MAKKHKSSEKQINHVIQSLKDLGVGGKDTLTRLATTVKADAATVILGNAAAAADKAEKKAAKKDAAKQTIALRAKAGLSRMAHHLHPAGEPAAQRQVARELKRLNKRVKKANQGPKPRKSRLPYVIAFGVLLALGGGAWLFSKINLPTVHVAQYLDYKKWLAHTAGHEAAREMPRAAPKAAAPQFEVVKAEPEEAPLVIHRPVQLPPAPKVLVYSSSKGAVGAKMARKAARPARRTPIALMHRSTKVKTASYRRAP